MKKAVKIVMALLVLSSTLFALSNNELAITIDLSGKQRMLTQKMTKEAFLIKLNIDKENNIKKLTESSQLFDKTLKGLIEGNKKLKLTAVEDKKIQTQLTKIVSIWNPFYTEIKNIINEKGNEKTYSIIDSKNSELLKEMNIAVELYAKQDKKSDFVLINDMNLAGKQRMLLQKMAKSLLVLNKEDFITSQKLFTRTLKGLKDGDKELKLKGTKLSSITKQLKVIDTLWTQAEKEFETALLGKNSKSVIVTLDKISEEMDKTVKLYAESLNRQRQRYEFASLIKIYTSLEKMDNQTRLLLEKLAKVEIE